MTTTTYVGVDLSGGTGGTSCLLVQTDSSCTLNPRCLFGKCVLCMGGGGVELGGVRTNCCTLFHPHLTSYCALP